MRNHVMEILRHVTLFCTLKYSALFPIFSFLSWDGNEGCISRFITVLSFYAIP